MTEDIREQVRKKYSQAITAKVGCCGSAACCGSGKELDVITGNLYDSSEVEGLPADLLATSFGCGNPTALGDLHAGETVLDLGSGAGLDALLSARRVGPYGKAYGLDMTDEMLAQANANKRKAGIANVEFLKGHIEDIPLPQDSVDVVISNCVINLSVDKDQVFREIFRVLKPGGRIAVSDIVTTKPLPQSVSRNLLAWAGCVAGALSREEYIVKLKNADFKEIEIVVTRVYDLKDLQRQNIVPGASEKELEEIEGALISAFIRAKKPAIGLEQGRDFIIRTAEENDFPAIHELLVKDGLTTEGVNQACGSYYIAEGKGIIGVLGVERKGRGALLRSLAVVPQMRKAKVADELMNHVLQVIKQAGCDDVYLLTNTAERYLNKFGFARIDRIKIPEALLESSALANACPASSICMSLKI